MGCSAKLFRLLIGLFEQAGSDGLHHLLAVTLQLLHQVPFFTQAVGQLHDGGLSRKRWDADRGLLQHLTANTFAALPSA